MANSFLAIVAKFGDIHITPTLILKNTHHVPKLSANLIYIKKLTYDLKCFVTFFLAYCVFQEQGSKRRIRLVKEILRK